MVHTCVNVTGAGLKCQRMQLKSLARILKVTTQQIQNLLKAPVLRNVTMPRMYKRDFHFKKPPET